MQQDLTPSSHPDPSEVSTLLEERSTVQGWLDRLEDQRGKVADHILDRVRDDYERRLRDTVDALASHREAVEAELQRAVRIMAEAEREHAHAVDRLEEGKLRNLIGELDHESWAAERARLEEAVGEGAQRENAARTEAARLRELLHHFEERASDEGGAPPEEEVRPGSAAGTTDEQSDAAPAVSPDAAPPFLAEIDRALSSDKAGSHDGDDPSAADLPVDDVGFEDTAPKPGLKCAECGYTNDLSAWYCGVCGADVG
jgi:hypothetical protein